MLDVEDEEGLSKASADEARNGSDHDRDSANGADCAPAKIRADGTHKSELRSVQNGFNFITALILPY